MSEALAFSAQLNREEADDATLAREAALYAEVFRSVGLPEWKAKQPRPPIPRAASLTSGQRTVAEISAYVEGAPGRAFCLPSASWVRRKWLGLDPPGSMFEVKSKGVPFYHLACETAEKDAKTTLALLGALPPSTRIPVLAELHLARYDHSLRLESALMSSTRGLRGELAAWAPAFADRLLTLFAKGRPKSERGGMSMIELCLKAPIFIALARSGVPIEPRWDVLFPLNDAKRGVTECIAVIPEERREAALAGALSRMQVPRYAVVVAVELLERYPYPAIARYALAHVQEAQDAERLTSKIKQIGKKHPPLAQVIGDGKALEVPRLRVAGRASIKLDGLDATARAQLGIANERYGGGKKTADALFAEEATAEEQIKPSSTERMRVEDERGNHLYDAWLYMADSGTIFAAGTTQIVAEVVQFGVECRDDKLRIALDGAFHRSSKERRGANDVTKKKRSSTRAVKNAVAKKTVKKSGSKTADARTGRKKNIAKRRTAKKRRQP
jgi:hypothetical protein